MSYEDIIEGAAVGDDMPLKMPFLAKDVVKQRGAGAAGFTVDAIIRTHDGFHPGIDQSFKGIEIGFPQVLFVDNGVEGVAIGFGSAVNGKMFGAGRGFEIARIIALDPFYKGRSRGCRQEWVFAIGLLAAAPAGCVENMALRASEA